MGWWTNNFNFDIIINRKTTNVHYFVELYIPARTAIVLKGGKTK